MTTPAYAEPTYVRGTLVVDTVLFQSLAGVLTDPSTITVTVISPQTSTTHTFGSDSFITRLSAGTYSVNVDTTPTNGRWTVRWVGLGALQAAVEDVFFVQSAA